MGIALCIAGVTVALLLARDLLRRFGSDRLDALVEERRQHSLVASRGEFVDGDRHIPVSMALTKETLFYDSDDVEASLELEWVSEVEYGAAPRGEVLRLRCYSQSFEFILPPDASSQWTAVLPPRH
jgi:hypothetical protein